MRGWRAHERANFRPALFSVTFHTESHVGLFTRAFRPFIRHVAPVHTSRRDRAYVALCPFIRIAGVFAGLVASGRYVPTRQCAPGAILRACVRMNRAYVRSESAAFL